MFESQEVENWASEFCSQDAIAAFSGSTREYATELLTRFLTAASYAREIEPNEIEEADVKAALLEHVAALSVPESVRRETPELCAQFLAWLQDQGRVGGGRALAAFVRALGESYQFAASGKTKPIVNAGSKIGRNDPCPCGSGRKYKKCCQRE